MQEVVEIARYGAKVKLSPEARQRQADIWGLMFRPAQWVLIAGLAVTLASFLWSFRAQRPSARKTSPRAASGAIQVQSVN